MLYKEVLHNSTLNVIFSQLSTHPAYKRQDSTFLSLRKKKSKDIASLSQTVTPDETSS